MIEAFMFVFDLEDSRPSTTTSTISAFWPTSACAAYCPPTTTRIVPAADAWTQTTAVSPYGDDQSSQG